jgi:DNA polymerase-3 subunit alpha
MRQLLKKLRCDSYKTLVDASSIIRPGVAESGMMREYIKRYHDPNCYTPLHPQLHEILKDTYDVMVFQEDVIRVGHEFAGLTLGEADVLRRAMSGKYRSNNTFLLIKEKYFLKCKERGHTDELAAEVWRQMESFAGYSFCKAHSASFAVESFQDLHLKVYYPFEFMVGVINNFGGFYSTDLYFYQLIKAGAHLNLPCVNKSEYLTYIEGTEVYTGLVHIKGMEKQLVEKILEERAKCGPYLHLQDFIERTSITLEPLETFIHIDALRFTGKDKKTLLWEAGFLQKKNDKHVPAAKSLFADKPREFQLPVFEKNPVDDMYDEQEILGFPLRNPFEMADDDPGKYCYAADIEKHLGKACTVLVYFIADKIVPTKKNTVMAFGTFIDAKLDWLDTVHFPESLRYYPMQGRGFYRITGKVVAEFGVYSLEVSHLVKVGYKQRSFANL